MKRRRPKATLAFAAKCSPQEPPIDRLLHHANVIITDGQDSYRLAQATAGKGVKPLT